MVMNNRTIKYQSYKKFRFLNSPNADLAYQLSAKELKLIANHYEKGGVKIFINGATEMGGKNYK